MVIALCAISAVAVDFALDLDANIVATTFDDAIGYETTHGEDGCRR